jgi:glycosyltransferase involved in cell wall biosynthesis
MQTEPDFELLVVDDASTDDTVPRVARIAMKEPRLRLLRRVCNGGPAAARNDGLNAATGDWIALLDADDTYAPTRLERLLAFAARHNADMVADNILLCDPSSERGMISHRVLSAPRQLSPAEFVARNVTRSRRARTSFGFLQPLVRRDFLARHGIRYDVRNRFGEDFLFALSCLLHGARWWLLPETLYRYRIRPGTATEVQTVGDLGRIRDVDTALLADPSVIRDARLAVALRRHLRVIERCYYYRAFTDAVKSGSLDEATSLLFESRASLRHILVESLAQAPVIGAKAMRGGYRRERPRHSSIRSAAHTQ